MAEIFPSRGERLNQSQKNHLLVTLKYADRLLTEIESLLAPQEPDALFRVYVRDIEPQEGSELASMISQLRKQMADALSNFGIPLPVPHIAARHAVMTNLDYIDMELEELLPRSMRAYGEVSAAAGRELEGMVQSIQATVRGTLAYLRQRSASR